MSRGGENRTEKLAAFIETLDAAALPPLAVQRATDGIIDCVGCALAGCQEKLAEILLRVGPHAAPGDSAVPLLGAGRKAPPGDAALYNGAVAHALDYDDITHPAYSHPSAVLVPTLMSLAGHASGLDAIAAYIVGIQVFGKLGRALNTSHYKKGWHATSTLGALAAAAAGARLVRLDRQQTRAALAIAASAASGLRANFGTMTKPLHCGYAARNGVLAVQLAREGFTAADDVLTHNFGFANTFNNRADIVWSVLDKWDGELEILSEFGLALKPYPACGATHTAIEAAVLLRKEIGAKLDSVSDIRVGVPQMSFEPLLYKEASTALEGKFSMHYVVAAALRTGDVNLATFTPEKLSDPQIKALLGKVRMEFDTRVAGSTEFAAVVTITLADGRKVEKLVPLAIGKPARWLSRDRLRRKFIDCASLNRGPDEAEKAFDRLVALAEQPRAEPVFESLA